MEPLGWPPTARIFQSPVNFQKGSLFHARLRASNEHILIVRVLRAKKNGRDPLLFSFGRAPMLVYVRPALCLSSFIHSQREGWHKSPLRASRDHRFIVGPLRAQRLCQPFRPPSFRGHAFREHRTNMGFIPLSPLSSQSH
jgi:hypothetical protein